MAAITLQISTAPTDIRFLEPVLNHQIKTLYEQVDEVLITADIRPSKGRFNFDDESISSFKKYLVNIQNEWPKARIEFVDYSDKAKTEVAKALWTKLDLPIKDYRGGPFYSYFYGIHKSSCEYILHLDSDILLGGGYSEWCVDALEQYNTSESILFIKPLSGPPLPDGNIPLQFIDKAKKYKQYPHSYLVKSFTTRAFLTSKTRLSNALKNIEFNSPDLIRSFYALWNNNPLVKAPEELISSYLIENEFYRLDYFGKEPGMWTLHPPFRSENFFKKLPSIIEAVEKNEIPAEQRGHFDINHAFIDWADAINALPFYRRYKARKRFLK